MSLSLSLSVKTTLRSRLFSQVKSEEETSNALAKLREGLEQAWLVGRSGWLVVEAAAFSHEALCS